LAGRTATVGFGVVVVLAALLYSSWHDVGVFAIMLNLSALLASPTATPLVLCLFIRRVPDWAAWSSVLVGVAAAAAVSAAPALIHQLDWTAAHWAGVSAWIAAHRYAAVTLVGVAFSAAWFLASAALFGRRIPASSAARIDAFFATIHRPVEPAQESVEQTNARGTRSICQMALLYAAFILLLVFIPNPPAARCGILLCCAFMGGVGLALWAVQPKRGPERLASKSQFLDKDLDGP